tara:strand:- start:88 stop:273 length:186 start_codon:yes stop_codon:yes gene_type:complete
MQFYQKTRRGFGKILIKHLTKIFVFIVILFIFIFVVSKLELPMPNKIIKQKIPNEKFKIIK